MDLTKLQELIDHSADAPENKVLNLSAILWNEFLKIPGKHPDDQNEFRLHLHNLQNLIYAYKYNKEVIIIDESNLRVYSAFECFKRVTESFVNKDKSK